MISPVAILVISGSMGAGKTTALAEASDLLTASNIAHAAIDLDTLSVGHFSNAPDDLAIRNLVALWPIYAAAGADRLLVAEAVDSREKLDRIRRAFPESAIGRSVTDVAREMLGRARWL